MVEFVTVKNHLSCHWLQPVVFDNPLKLLFCFCALRVLLELASAQEKI